MRRQVTFSTVLLSTLATFGFGWVASARSSAPTDPGRTPNPPGNQQLRFQWHAPEAWPGAAVHLGIPVPVDASRADLRLELEEQPIDADFFPMGSTASADYEWALAVFPMPDHRTGEDSQDLVLRWDPRGDGSTTPDSDDVKVARQGDGLVLSSSKLQVRLDPRGLAELTAAHADGSSASFRPTEFGPALRWSEQDPWEAAEGQGIEVLRDGRRSALIRVRSNWTRSTDGEPDLMVEQEFELVADSNELSVQTRLIGLPGLPEATSIEAFAPLRGVFDSEAMRELGVVTWPLGGDSVRGERLAVHQRHRGFWVERGGSVARRGRAAGLTVDWASWKANSELDVAVIFPRLREDGPHHPGRETRLDINDDGLIASHFGPELPFPGESGARPRQRISLGPGTARTERWVLVLGRGPSTWAQRGRALRSTPWISYGDRATEFGVLPERAPLGIFDDLIRRLTEPLVRDTFTRTTSSTASLENGDGSELDWLSGSLARKGGATPLLEIGALEPLAARRFRRHDQRATRRFERAAFATLDRTRAWSLEDSSSIEGLDDRPFLLEELLHSHRILGHPDFLESARRLANQALASTRVAPSDLADRRIPTGPWLAAQGDDPLRAAGLLPSLAMLADLTGDATYGEACDALLRGLLLEELAHQREAFQSGEMLDLDRWGEALAGALRVLDRRPDPECLRAIEDFALWVRNRATAGVDDLAEVGRARWPEGGVGTVPRRLGPRWDSLTEAPPASVGEARSRWARDLAAAPWLGREPAMLEGAHWAEVQLHLFHSTGEVSWFQAAQANLLPILGAPTLGRPQRSFELDEGFRRLLPALTRCAGMLEAAGLPFLVDARLPKEAHSRLDSNEPSAHLFLDRVGHQGGGIHRWRILRKRNFGLEHQHYDGPIKLRIRTPRGRPERVLLDGQHAVFRWSATPPSIEIELPSLTDRTTPWSEVAGDPTLNHLVHELVVEP